MMSRSWWGRGSSRGRGKGSASAVRLLCLHFFSLSFVFFPVIHFFPSVFARRRWSQSLRLFSTRARSILSSPCMPGGVGERGFGRVEEGLLLVCATANKNKRREWQRENLQHNMASISALCACHTHTNIHTYMYIYIYLTYSAAIALSIIVVIAAAAAALPGCTYFFQFV